MGEIKIESKSAPGPFTAPVDRARAHDLTPDLPINPVVAETCDPALALAGKAMKESKAIQEMKMANDNVKVPTDWSADEEKRALAKVNEVDPKKEQDLIFTGIRKGGFALFFVRARAGKADDKSGLRRVVDQRLIWLPAAVTGSLADFVAFFAMKYGDGDAKAGETVFKKKAIDAELVTIRSKMKAKPGTGKKRGKTLV